MSLPDFIEVLALRTPTLPPADATNTAIIGRRRLLVIEPATPHGDERRRLDERLAARARGGAEVAGILITHHHVDHIGYVDELRAQLNAPVYAHEATADRVSFAVDHLLSDGERIELDDGIAIEAHHTPGHAPGHLVYREVRSGFAHVGDMVAGTGTILIDPQDDGDMAAYLRSLRAMLTWSMTAMIPAHGPVLDQPSAVLEHYIEHRLGREAKVLAAIAGGGSTEDEVLAGAYADTPRAVWGLAARSLEAHLRKLEADGTITRSGGRVRPCPGGNQP